MRIEQRNYGRRFAALRFLIGLLTHSHHIVRRRRLHRARKKPHLFINEWLIFHSLRGSFCGVENKKPACFPWLLSKLVDNTTTMHMLRWEAERALKIHEDITQIGNVTPNNKHLCCAGWIPNAFQALSELVQKKREGKNIVTTARGEGCRRGDTLN